MIWEKLTKIDRRYIFLFIGIVVLLPIVFNLKVSVKISDEVLSAYKEIDNLPKGSAVMISIDYDAASMPELQPMLKAILRHCFKKELKVILINFWPLGVPIGAQGLEEVAREFNKTYGVDYINLGYRPGDVAVMLRMGIDIKKVFYTDLSGRPLDSLPIMNNIKNYDDIGILVGLEAGAMGDAWIQYVGTRFKQKIILGVTAVMAAEQYPYLQAGQIVGLIGGLKGAAEYETLVNIPGTGLVGMASQTYAHLTIIFFIIIGNISYFVLRRKGKKK
uniref:Uncharacterized protein n=1 Tax=candidate division WOR-3 bacterium TaxID=2052148 RepID=A0A7C4U6Z6_UNCW3